MKTLKARFPLSDKFFAEFTKAVKLGVDFTTLSSTNDIVSLDKADVVKKQLFCVECLEPVIEACERNE